MKKRVMWILIGILIVLIAILSFLNVDNVPVNFSFTTAYWPLILVIVGSFVIGALTAGLLAMIRDIRYTRQIKNLEHKLQIADEVKKQEVEKAEYQYVENIDRLKQLVDEKDQTIRSLERKLSNTQINTDKDFR